jgi:hypothetical protein
MSEDKTPKMTDRPKHFENLLAPEMFASEATAFSIHAGVISITFGSNRYDNSTVPPTLNQVVVGRLVMPPAGAKNLALGLYNFLAQNGMEPIKRPKDATDVQ